MIDMLDLIAEAKLRPGKMSQAEEMRELVAGADASPQAPCRLRLRHSHHMLARVLAEGKSNVEAAALTGYAPSTISALKADPAFQELLAYYDAQVTDLFASIQDRIGALGVSFLDELQHRLEDTPEAFSITQLRQLAESLLDRSIAPAKGGPKGPAGAPTAIAVKIDFGGTPTARPVLELESAP